MNLTNPDKYKKILEWIKKNKLKTSGIVFLAFIVLFLIFASIGADAESEKVTTKSNTIYSTEVDEVSVNSDHDWKIKGSTSAPDGAKILVYYDNSKDYDNNNVASNASGTAYAKVKDGEFEAVVDFIDLAVPVDKDTTKDAEISVKTIAVTGSLPSYEDSDEVSEGIQTAAEKFDSNELTVTSSQVKYSKSLDEDDDSESSSESSSSSSSSSTSFKMPHDKSFYSTDITYDQIARNPKDYLGKGMTFTGKVVQTIEEDGKLQAMRVALNSDYDQMVYVEVSSSALKDDSRVLEDDIITLKGIGAETISYEATSGATITLPAIYAGEIVDQGRDTSGY